MNISLASFLVEDKCRPLKVEYDPDVAKNNNYSLFFKTLDETIQVDDLVVVPTGTRHGFTVVKVKEVDFVVNYDGNDTYQWIVHKVDKEAYEQLLKADKTVQQKVGKIEETKKKQELMAAMGLNPGTVSNDFKGLALANPPHLKTEAAEFVSVTDEPAAAPAPESTRRVKEDW